MRDSDILISSRGGAYSVKVSGRANFEYAVPLRNIAKTGAACNVLIDLKDCTAMDSTFMGVLTMLALKNKKSNAVVELYNAGAVLQKLLRDLGVIKLFVFKEGEPGGAAGSVEANAPADRLSTAETVAEAHKTLVDADESNREKFRSVIDFADADVVRLKKEPNL